MTPKQIFQMVVFSIAFSISQLVIAWHFRPKVQLSTVGWEIFLQLFVAWLAVALIK